MKREKRNKGRRPQADNLALNPQADNLLSKTQADNLLSIPKQVQAGREQPCVHVWQDIAWVAF